MAETSLRLDPQARYTPSPEDWRDEVIYFAFVDRFARARGDKPSGDPESGTSWHGGSIRGLTSKLDYIKGTGATAIWLTPVVENDEGGYHGYSTKNFLCIDPRFGTMGDLRRLVKEAHARGMRVILDVVVNHSGRAFEYKDGDGWSTGRKEIARWNYRVGPAELANPESYNCRGNIDDWDNYEKATKGDFCGLRDFATHDKSVQNKLIRTWLWMIKETDVDGFRLDTVKHTDPSMWPRFVRAVRCYAAKMGKKNFLLLGEIYDGSDQRVAKYVGHRLGTDPRSGAPLGMDALNFPAQMRDTPALHGEAPTRRLEDSLRANLDAFGDDTGRLGRFIDNHDIARFLKPGEPEDQLKVALAHTFLTSGMPIIYYGTEQGFRQPEGKPINPGNREDQFAGSYESESSQGDKFDPQSPMYCFIQRLAGVRAAYPALRRGKQRVHWSDPHGAGLYAFSRVEGDEEVVVLLNTAGHPVQAANIWLDRKRTPPGTKLVDALGSGYELTVKPRDGDRGSQIDVELPARGVRVLVRKDDGRFAKWCRQHTLAGAAAKLGGVGSALIRRLGKPEAAPSTRTQLLPAALSPALKRLRRPNPTTSAR